MKFYQPPVARAREIQLRRWRAMCYKLQHVDEYRELFAQFDIPPEALDKLVAAGALVAQAIELVESQTRP